MSGKSHALRGDALVNGRIVPDALIETRPKGGESVIVAVGPAGRRAAAARARRIDGVIAPEIGRAHV